MALFQALETAKIEETVKQSSMYLRFGTSYINLIMLSVYSLAVPPTFIVKVKLLFDILELAVGAAVC